MTPQEGLISEQRLQMKMMMLDARHIQCLTDGEFTEDGVVFNMIEVLSDEVTLTNIFQYHPQTNTYEREPLMFTLKQGVYLGYFRDLCVNEGEIRIAIW